MSKTEGLLILDTQNVAAGGDKAEKAAGPCPQSVARRKLADISNLPQKTRPLIQDNKSQSVPTTIKAYIEQLQKENMALVRMLAQRNKIIEQSGIELERLRLSLIKMQEQNQQLALSHTQMLTELNFGKDRLKALQHELGCKTGLLKARKLEGGEACKVPCQSADAEGEACKVPCQSADAEVNLIELPEEGETSTVSKDDEKPRTTKRRLRSQSFGSSEPLQSEENAGNKRPPPARRQSARFKAIGSKSAEDPFEKDDTKFPECPLPDEPMLENGSTSGSASVKHEDNRSSSGFKYESQETGRSSLCRPSRLAAKKVQSYKEIPLKVKMRRSE